MAATGAFSWDTTDLAGASGISGTSTYDLKFQWTGSEGASSPYTSSVTLTVKDAAGDTETQTYSFVVPTGSWSSSGGTGSITWADAALPPGYDQPGRSRLCHP